MEGAAEEQPLLGPLQEALHLKPLRRRKKRRRRRRRSRTRIWASVSLTRLSKDSAIGWMTAYERWICKAVLLSPKISNAKDSDDDPTFTPMNHVLQRVSI